MSDINIKSLWKGQRTPDVDLSAMRKKIKYFKLRRMGESYAIIILMILAIAFGLIVWIYWTPMLTVTKIGLILLTIGLILPILSHAKQIRLYYGLKIDSSNVDYVNHLLKIKRQEYRQQHLILNLYFLFLSLGFVLYSYEYTFCHSFYRGIIVYSILLLWIAINWFVLRKFIIRKRNRKFSDFMNMVEKHKKQLSE